MRISIIVARAENGVIGYGNLMPWHLPEDLKHFKRITMGKPVIMGRRTMESIGRALPGRMNIVISRQAGLASDGFVVTPSLQAALRHAAESGAAEAMVIGGGQIYEQAIACADRLYVTEVHAKFHGDTRFEMPDPKDWHEVSRDRRPAEQDRPAYSFVVYERR